MSDTGSILLATTILALGGLGLYAYKSFNDDTEDSKYNEDSLFGGNFWSSFNGDKEEKYEDDDDDASVESETESEDKYNTNMRKKSSKSKRTQKNNKSNGSSRRKY